LANAVSNGFIKEALTKNYQANRQITAAQGHLHCLAQFWAAGRSDLREKI